MEGVDTPLSVHFQSNDFLRQLQSEATRGQGMFEAASLPACRLVVDMAAHIAKLNRGNALDRSPSLASRAGGASTPHRSAVFVPMASLTHSVVTAPPSTTFAKSPSGAGYRSGSTAASVSSSAKKRNQQASGANDGSMKWIRLHRAERVQRVREVIRALESCSHVLLTELQNEWCLPPADIDERDAPRTDWTLDQQRDALARTRVKVVEAVSELEHFVAESFTTAEKRLIGGNTQRLQSAKARATQFQYYDPAAHARPDYLDEHNNMKRTVTPGYFYDPTRPAGDRRVASEAQPQQPSSVQSASRQSSRFESSRSRPTFVEDPIVVQQPPPAQSSNANTAAVGTRSDDPAAPHSTTSTTVAPTAGVVAPSAGSRESTEFAISEDDTTDTPSHHTDQPHQEPLVAAGHTPPPEGPAGDRSGTVNTALAVPPAARPLDFGSPTVGGADPPSASERHGNTAPLIEAVHVEPADHVPPHQPQPAVVVPSSNAGVARKIVVSQGTKSSPNPAPTQSGGATPQHGSAPEQRSSVTVRRVVNSATPPNNGPSQPPNAQPATIPQAAASSPAPMAAAVATSAPNQGSAPRQQPTSAASQQTAAASSPTAIPHVGRPPINDAPIPQSAQSSLTPAQIRMRQLAQHHSDSDSEDAA